MTKSAYERMGKHIVVEILDYLVMFCDFDLLMKVMSTMKQFREDFTKSPTPE